MSSAAIGLVAGLGNPGPEYEQSRHNAGFWLVDGLARHYGGSFRNERRHQGEACRVSIGGHSVWLLKPLTYMNRSGQSVVSLARFYKVPPAAMLIVHDDLDLAPGTVRLKRGGGHGGNNGLRDIIRALGDADFWRLRLGIGHPGPGADVSGYVLRRAAAADREAIEAAIDQAERVFGQIVAGDFDQVMNELHRRRPAPA